MKIFNKISNFLIEDQAEKELDEETTLKAEKTVENSSFKKEEPTADGTTNYTKDSDVSNKGYERYSTSKNNRTNIRTNKTPDMRIIVFNIDAFDEVKMVADALKQKRAVLINYEKVNDDVQKRICDFVNGVCYVLNGGIKRISNTMVLYVPENISIGDGIVRGTTNSIFADHAAS